MTELDKKTQSMLELIGADADSFAHRAEMYRKKRPELIGMVEDFYRMHRSSAERYDKLISVSVSRGLTTLGSPFATKCRTETFFSVIDSDSHSEIYDPEDCAKHEVDDAEHKEEEAQLVEVSEEVGGEEEEKLETGIDDKMKKVVEVDVSRVRRALNGWRKELEKVKQENLIQRDQLLQKDEKGEEIRQLSLAVEVIKLENIELRKIVGRENSKNKNNFQFDKMKDAFVEKLLKAWAPKSQHI